MGAGAVAALGEVDILVNNAGVHAAAPMLETTEEAFDRVVAINVTGAFLCARAVAPGMCARRYGRIIGISSDCGKRGGKVSGVHFSASKAALQGLTRSLARQLAPHGVTANDVAPSLIETERWHETLHPASIALRAARVPVGRLGRPGDVAAAVLYLASDKAGFVTGASIDVAGGGYIG
jgi:NAD(P)-dependent dehydrogenase (short-subunit alcohol dehydrogenase family)